METVEKHDGVKPNITNNRKLHEEKPKIANMRKLHGEQPKKTKLSKLHGEEPKKAKNKRDYMNPLSDLLAD